jgi:hypothetical protein
MLSNYSCSRIVQAIAADLRGFSWLFGKRFPRNYRVQLLLSMVSSTTSRAKYWLLPAPDF